MAVKNDSPTLVHVQALREHQRWLADVRPDAILATDAALAPAMGLGQGG